MKKYRMFCPNCDSERVLRDAWSVWDFENQKWVLHSSYQNGYCEDCEENIDIDAEEIEEESQ